MTEPEPTPTDASRSSISRLLRNIGWLLGGKGVAAVCSLIYLAILARSLGLKGFGHFSLITGTALALSALAGFQTWRVVVRFGVAYVHEQDWSRFGRLAMLCCLLDLISAILGCGLAAIMIYGFSEQLSLNSAYIDTAFLYCCLYLFAMTSAMTGVLRTIDRFDMMIYIETFPMIARLVVSLGILWVGPSVLLFLMAWAVIGLIEAVIYWAVAKRLAPEAIRWRHLLSCGRAMKENPGLLSFCGITYSSGTLDALIKQGPLLAVGAFVGTQQAGLYRLASQMAQSLSKVSTLLTRAVYPEVTRSRLVEHDSAFRTLARRISLVSGGAGAIVIGLALAIGGRLLGWIGGTAFEAGGAILVCLAIAASFDLGSVAFEPVLHSSGKAHRSLWARCIAALALGIGMVVLIPWDGAVGMAWAVALSGMTSYFALAIFVWRTLKVRSS